MTPQDIQLVEDMIRQMMPKTEQSNAFQQSQIFPKTIKARHIDGVIVQFGLAANRPTTGNTGTRAYFATNTGVLSMWSGSAWLTTTLT